MSGDHDWKITIQYHQCPNCGFITESRQDYTRSGKKYVKTLECDRCHNKFTVEKKVKKRFGPLFGEPSPPEFDWNAT